MIDKRSAPDRGTIEVGPTGADAGREDSFLSRWSRRKAGSAQRQIEPAPDEPAHRPAPAAATDFGQRATATDVATPAAEPELPDLDSLDENSDYSAFLSPRVSEKLQRLALRKLFMSSGFNVRDGLDDYDDDFTHFEPLGNIVTADMKHQIEVERQRLAEAGEAADEPGAADAGDAGQHTAADDEDRAAAVASDTTGQPRSEAGAGAQAPAEDPEAAAGQRAAIDDDPRSPEQQT